MNDPSTTPEERETIAPERDRMKDEVEQHKTVERIIAHRETEDGHVQYGCKWNGLNYEHCTWEPQDEIRPIAQAQIDAYRNRERVATFPYKSKVYPKLASHVLRDHRGSGLHHSYWRRAEGLPADRALVGLPVMQRLQRYPGRRDGSRQGASS